jgi:hypothetical protein
LIQKSKHHKLPYALTSLLTALPRETERDWDKDLADDVKGECEEKYGPVDAIKVERETQVPSPLLEEDHPI